MTPSEIVARISISTLWRELGGGEIRRGRARAFWRDGDGWNISLNDAKGAWFDHRDGIGGGVLDLVVHVRGGSRQDAVRRVAEVAGVPLDDKPMPAADKRRWATQQREHDRVAAEAVYFEMAARTMAEFALETMSPWDDQRPRITELMTALHVAPDYEYRQWLEKSPDMAAALVAAGKSYAKRVQVMVAHFIAKEMVNGAAA
jgi:hypothetical protein